MAAGRQPVAAARADLDEAAIHALIDTANGGPYFAPDFLAGLKHVADRETGRRHDLYFPLPPPEAAIDPREDQISISAAMLRPEIRRSDRLQ